MTGPLTTEQLDGNRCDDCGCKFAGWYTHEWSEVVDGEGMLCILCFLRRAVSKGMLGWRCEVHSVTDSDSTPYYDELVAEVRRLRERERILFTEPTAGSRDSNTTSSLRGLLQTEIEDLTIERKPDAA